MSNLISADITTEPCCASRTVAAQERSGWGAAWPLTAVAAIGLLVVTWANALSRSGKPGSPGLFWIGILIIVGPIAWRVLGSSASRSERIVLVVAVAMALYCVKVVRDPFAFTFADELVHQHNANEILRTGSLFGTNSILPITPLYPGLSSATAALAALTGMTTFGAGLIVVAVARLLGTLALFMLVEGALGSDRAAAMAVLIYVGVPNYMFFSSQFAYESLALPMALLILSAVVKRTRLVELRDRRSWKVLSIVLIPAVVMTHHLTSYALFCSLLALCVTTAMVRRFAYRWSERRSLPQPIIADAPVMVTLCAGAAVATWLALAGRQTSRYLSPVLSQAVTQTWQVLKQEAPPRALFQSGADAAAITAVAPSWERIAGLGAVALLVVWIPFGLLALRRQRMLSAMLALSALGSMAYLATFPLRFVPAAWETAARASEFLFIAVATVVAATSISHDSGRNRILRRAAATLAIPLLAIGGVIAGWPTDRRVAAPYRVDRGGVAFESQVIEFARWSLTSLGAGQRIATEPSDARVLQLYGRQIAVAGVSPDVQDVLHLRRLDPWMITLLHDHDFRFVAVDRRIVSADSMAGYFFTSGGSPAAATRSKQATDKFDVASAARVFDSGDIVVYDVEHLSTSTPLP